MPCDFSCPEFQTSEKLKLRSSEVPARCPSASHSEVKLTSDHFGGAGAEYCEAAGTNWD
uniref:Uncharacterized protein n=1 Tax=Moniliophthora roreri TaxID=221103 RepID=A0A0W0F7G6_MONRR